MIESLTMENKPNDSELRLRLALSRIPYVTFGFSFVLFILLYSPLFTYSELEFNIDDTYDYYGAGYQLYLAAGRWGLALVRYFTSGVPMTTGILVCDFFVSAALVLQIRIFRIASPLLVVLYIVASLSSFQYVSWLLFSVMTDVTGCGIFLATSAAYFLLRACRLSCWKKEQWRNILFGVLLVTLAVGFYQTVVLLYCCIVIAFAIQKGLKSETIPVRELFLCAASAAFAVFFTLTVKYFSVSLGIVSSDVLSATQKYQDSLVHYDALFAMNVGELCRTFAFYLLLWIKLAFGASSTSGILGCLVVVPVSFIVYGVMRNIKGGLHKCLILILLGGLLMIPYVLPILFCIPSAAHESYSNRMFTAAPTVYAFLWVTSLGYLSRGVNFLFVRRSIVFLMILGVFHAMYQINSMAKGAHQFALNFNKELILLEGDVNRMAAEKGRMGSEIRKIVIQSGTSHGQDVHAANPLIRNFHIPTPSEYELYKPIWSKMPTWPSKGAIRWINNDTVIINFHDRD